MLATRDGYGIGLENIGSDEKIVALDADLSDSTKSNKFAKKYPERFFEMGISEADMICTAAGLASCDKIPFASSFASFLMRSLDQIFVSVAYSKMNVKIIGSHGGIATGEDGPTAQCLIDIGCMRTIPNMIVINPADGKEAERATETISKYIGPVYMRTARSKTPVIFDDDYEFKIGKASVIKDGSDLSILSTGIMLNEVLTARDMLEKNGISVEILNVPTVKPIDKDTIIKTAKKTGNVITCEDHNIINGLGSAVSDVLCNYNVNIKKVGLNDRFAESGNPKELYEKYGLSSESIAKNAIDMLKR
ncbi:transketolase family protein [Candidatus Aenigmatarchaeota archaeon]